MPQLIKQFSGIMNTDDSAENIPTPHHRISWNGRFRGNGNNRRFEGVEGTTLIPNNYLPAIGNNECIGSFTDSIKQRLIWFNYNSEGYNAIFYLDIKTKIIYSYLRSLVDSATDIFDFSLDYPIPSVNIIYASDDIGDTLCWTDRLNRPMKLNLKQAVDAQYGATWVQDYLTVSRPMGLICPSCRYMDDATVVVNNLRKTLYEFRYKWVYRDNTESCWSPYSKLFAPLDPDTLATNLDPTKNNRIDVTLSTGDKDCVSIKVAARSIVGTVFSDDYLVETLSKSGLSIHDNSIYIYRFFNDSSYPFIDVSDSTLLFDYVPNKANSQELLNGNVILYGGITEGVNFNVTLDITNAVTLFTNGVESLSCQSSVAGRNWDFVFFGVPVTGDVVTIEFNVLHDDTTMDSYGFSYVVQIGDDRQDISDYFETQIDLSANIHATQITPGGGIGIRVFGEIPLDVIQDGNCIIDYAPATPSTDDVSNSVYKNNSKYRFVQIYFNEFGETNGAQTSDGCLVTTLELDTTGGTKMKVNNIALSVNHQPPMGSTNFSFGRTLNLTVDTFIPFISATTEKSGTTTTDFGYIEVTNLQTNQNNFPTYSFTIGDRVRIIGEFVNGGAGTVSVLDFPIADLVTSPVIGATTKTGQIYIKIPYSSSISAFGTTQHYYCEVYTPALKTSIGDQIFFEFGETYLVLNPNTATRSHQGKRQDQFAGTTSIISAPLTAATATLVVSAGALSIGDYTYYVEYVNAAGVNSVPSPISNTITTVPASQQINLTAIPVSPDPLVVQRKIYRTIAGGGIYYLLTTIADNVTTTYNDNIADASLGTQMPQPAIYDFARGDVYIGNRQFPITTNLQTINKMWLLNIAVSDYYSSTIVGNGRAFVIDKFAVQTYYSTLLRWGLAYVDNTNINQVNKFFPLNQDSIDRMKGDIQRLLVEERLVYVYQNRAVGQMGIYSKFIQNNEGDPQLVTTNEIITSNNVNYLQGEYGVGDQYCGIVRSRGVHYFADPVVGGNIRRSGDGLINLSEKYKGQFYIKDLLTPYNKTWLRTNGSKAKIIGFYNFVEEEYNTILQSGTNTGDEILPYTFSFNELRNGYSSFFEIYPEWATSANEIVYIWKNGQLYEQTNKEKYCNFFDEQFYPSIELVFNENEGIKKNYNGIAYQSNRIWSSPTAGDIYTSLEDGQTDFKQISLLAERDYEIDEGKRIASFLRDISSMSDRRQALTEGNYLQGFYMVIKLSYIGSEYSWIYLPYITWELNNRQV